MTTTPFNPEQLRAIEATGLVFVSAGAGTGKTRVLVERFARAVIDRGLAPDRVLAITYTERAAAELAARIRRRLADAGRPELARGLDGAYISTIHGFCSRLLRRYALQAGIDPAFAVLDAHAADLLRAESYDAALRALAVDRDEIVDLVTAYSEDRLRLLIDTTHEQLRTAGHPLAFEPTGPIDLDGAIDDARAAAAALIAAPGTGVTLDEARARAAGLALVLDTPPDAAVLSSLAEYEARGRLVVARPYDAALGALERAARDATFEAMRPLLDELLAAVAAEYSGRKRAGSLLDFDDLQLETRRLLESREDVRAEVRARFAEVMVDEFQDTNELQCAIIDAVAAPDAALFFVGDEFQSIYRFRHADVAVFRRRRAEIDAAGGDGAISLRTNYRSRPEVLAVVNHLFGEAFGPTYEPLTAGSALPDLAAGEPAVEFLVTDADGSPTAHDARLLEARTLAERIRTLVDGGACSAGDVVLLFSAATDADVYEAAVQAVGLDTVSAAGRRYFDAQPVRDVTAYLRLLRNRYDDVALLGVLASPLVGVSNDTLSRLRAAAPRRVLFAAVEHGLPGGLATDDARLLAAFRQRFDRLVEALGRTGLAALVERIVDDHDYDLALLANRDGTRRLANVRKLARLAREFEALRGPDIEGFLSTVEVRRLADDREPEALVAEEDADAVRLLTVHAAKGLEFPVVVVADAGRGGGGGRQEPIVALPDGRVGVKVPDAGGEMRETSAFSEARGIDRSASDEERRRVSYVALTRAVDRLIVSGVVRAGEQQDTPIAWMLRRLGVSMEPGQHAVDVPGGSVSVRISGPPDDPPPLDLKPESQSHVEVEGQLALFTALGEVAPLPPFEAVDVPAPLAALPQAPAERPGRLSFSALHLHERCPFRFHAERVLGFSARERAGTRAAAGLDGAELGTVVHDTLEHPGRDVAVALARFPHATIDNTARASDLVRAWETSALAGRVAAATQVRREVPFLLDGGDAGIAGRLDLVGVEGATAVVVDYKTNRVAGTTPAAIRDESYRLQEAVYALALLEHGHETVEVHFAFLDADEAVMRSFGRSELEELRGTVQAAVTAAVSGPFPPRPGEVCHDCPVLGLLCAGPDLDALHGAPDTG